MRGFGSILWTAGAAGAVLSCYLVSLGVASSRAELERVETDIAMAMRDIRTLETEIGTRGRLSQLERWNENFLQLSAPEADQFAKNAYLVAAMARPETVDPIDSPVILASAPRYEEDISEDEGASVAPRLIQASYTTDVVTKPTKPAQTKSAETKSGPKKRAAEPAEAGPRASSPEPAHPRAPAPVTASTYAEAKAPPPPPTPKVETKRERAPTTGGRDPLAPLPTGGAGE